jgi:hypothetical protein
MGTAADQIPGYGGAVPDAQSQLTGTQQAYQTARPFIAPTAEMLGTLGGSVLGGVAGAAGGPVGSALGITGGAGLGYGMAKETMKLGDIYLGGQTPEQAQTQPMRNVAEGAAFEVAGRGLGQVLSKAGSAIAGLRNAPQQRAARLAQTALGKDLPEVVNALRSAPPNASVAQLTAKIENPTWQALVKETLEKDPQFVRKLRLTDARESRNILSELAGGVNAAEIRATNELAKSNLNAITTPMRETALSRANLGRDVAAFEAQAGKLSADATQKVSDVRRLIKAGDLAEAAGRLELIKKGVPVGFTKFTYKGELAKMADDWATGAANASLDLGQGARFAQGAADSLRSVGIKPLEGRSLVKNISNLANKPEFAGNDLISGAAKNVADDILKWTNSGGVIDVVALEAIRKNSVNATIQQLRPGADATAQRNLAAGVMSKIKPMIDDAIEGAGGVGWRDYLTRHAQGMQDINAKKLTGEAAKLWKKSPDEFVRLVQNESPEVVEKFLGPGNYNIATELAEETMDVLRSQANKHLTQLSVNEQATEGGKALAELVKQQLGVFRVPGYLNFWATTSNRALGQIETRLGVSTVRKLTEAMKTPEGARDLLATMPNKDRIALLKMLSDPTSIAGKSAGATMVGVTNALTPADENQNALNERPR